jgi:cleavage and polyadenylation specificity factor subunit 2
MARIAILQEATDIRSEENVDAAPTPPQSSDDTMDESGVLQQEQVEKLPCIATLDEINDAFQSIITLRYSQPTHLAGMLFT